MANVTIQTIRIYLDTVETENPNLGIYTAGTSEIRLSEVPLSGVAESWTSGLIAENGIGEINEGGDLSRGGAVAFFDGITVNLINTNQYILALKDIGVYLPGCKCIIEEFVGTELDSDSVSRDVIFTGIIEDLSWTETDLGIPIKNAAYRRNALMSEPLGDGASEIKPVTFGQLYGEINENGDINGNIAKFIRTNSTIDNDKYSHASFTTGQTYPEWKTFPIVDYEGGTSAPTFFMISLQTTAGIPTSPVFPQNMYVMIVDGDSAIVGKIRKVYKYEETVSNRQIKFTITDVFNKSFSISPSDRTWVKFFDVTRDYIADSWPCKSFLETSGSATNNPVIVAYENKYTEIARYAYNASSLVNNNKMSIDPKHYEDDIYSINGFNILPISSIALETESDLTNWKNGSLTGYSSYLKVTDGIYRHTSYSAPTISNNTGLTNPSYAYDKNSTTYAEWNFDLVTNGGSEFKYMKVLKFGLPSIPKSLKFTKVFLALKAISKVEGFLRDSGGSYSSVFSNNVFDSTAYKSIHIVCKRYSGTEFGGTLIWTSDNDRFLYDLLFREDTGVNLNDFPDFYFSDNPANNNSFFYSPSSAVAGKYPNLYGYTLFELSDYTPEILKTISEIGIFFTRTCAAGYDDSLAHEYLKVFEAALIFQTDSASIDGEIYSPLSGRTYNSTWGARKTSTDLINNPVDIIEHACRLQNWSETGDTTTVPGLEYSSGALIKTSGAGSFDDASLATAKAYRPAFQIFDEAKAYTADLKKTLCATYNLCSRIDEDGNECIYPLSTTNPAEVISFGDINGEIGEIIEPRLQDVFCEPQVNYLFNPGSNKYDKSLKVFNIVGYAAGGSWSDSSSGFANQTDAESILDLCATLYSKFRSVEKTPVDFSDQNTITLYADALSYLTEKLNWMGKRRVSLSVFYDKGKTYYFGYHLKIRLPHQTNDNEIECIVENITKSKNQNRVSLDLVLIEDIPALV